MDLVLKRSPEVAALPQARGPLTERLFHALARAPHPVPYDKWPIASADDDELHLALYCCYELHYRGFAGVDEGWEWEPTVLAARQAMEARVEKDLRREVGPVCFRPGDVPDELWRLATTPGGPSLSRWVAENAQLWHLRELAKHRSAYQLKEADPHTWAIPRVPGQAKAVMVAIQADEYGNGRGPDMHASLFADTMECLGLSAQVNAYVDELPGTTLATTNLISLFGLHRRMRGSLVGHLALFEMTSTGPMGRYSAALTRLGLPERARRFYDVHVLADEVHQHLAVDGMVASLLADEPELADDIVFGARALNVVEARVTEKMLADWGAGQTSLRNQVG